MLWERQAVQRPLGEETIIIISRDPLVPQGQIMLMVQILVTITQGMVEEFQRANEPKVQIKIAN